MPVMDITEEFTQTKSLKKFSLRSAVHTYIHTCYASKSLSLDYISQNTF